MAAKTPIRLFLATCAALALCFAVGGSRSTPRATTPRWLVDSYRGDVEVRLGSGPWRRVAPGIRLSEMDSVRTGASGQLVLVNGDSVPWTVLPWATPTAGGPRKPTIPVEVKRWQRSR